MRLQGWQITGEIPNLPKLVVIGIPHTTNWDGYFAMASVMAMRLRIAIMIKESALKGLLGRFLRSVGFFGVDRSRPGGVVEHIVQQMHAADSFWFCIAPEGTRRGASEIKSGFHRVAKEAGVPVAVAVINYRSKRVHFAGTVSPGEDREADLRTIAALAAEYGHPQHPERLSKPVREATEALKNS